MDIKIYTNISDNLKEDEIEITIKANKNNNIVGKIVDSIQSISDSIDTIIGSYENNICVINVEEVMFFYSSEQYNYCKTQNGDFRIKKKLYELEESLNKKDFIRISNSCIANVKYVKSFDLSTVGSIIVVFKDNTTQDVSKRRITNVMKFLKERGN